MYKMQQVFSQSGEKNLPPPYLMDLCLQGHLPFYFSDTQKLFGHRPKLSILATFDQEHSFIFLLHLNTFYIFLLAMVVLVTPL